MGNFNIVITVISVVIPLVITVVVLFFVFRMLGNLSKFGQATQQILTTGVPATATILQLEDGGMRVNDNPMVNVVLEVNSAQFGTYQTAVRSIVPFIKLAQVQPGQTVNVKIDPNNPQSVALDLR